VSAADFPRSALRLPAGEPQTAAMIPPGGLRNRLEELELRSFAGRVELAAMDWQADLLLRAGRPLAAALRRPTLPTNLHGVAALSAVLDQAEQAWSLRLHALDGGLLDALSGLGAEPVVVELSAADQVRQVLRELADKGRSGVLEIEAGESWARTLIAGGKLLGAYSDLCPSLEQSLGPLGALIGGPAPRLNWFAATAAVELSLPVSQVVDAGAAEVERQVVWIVSRFEGSWSRARQGATTADDLEMPLVQLVAPLQALAGELEATRADPEALDRALARLAGSSVLPGRLAELDPRLNGLGPEQARPLLVELVADALRRIVVACPDPNLADCCRQAAAALNSELRLAFPAAAPPVAHGAEVS
jgi:hypothetical protein